MFAFERPFITDFPPILRTEPALPMLRIKPALPILSTQPMLRRLPKLNALSTESGLNAPRSVINLV